MTMINPEDRIFLVASILIGIAGIYCLTQFFFFGAMSFTVLSIAGVSSHFRARKKEKKRLAMLEEEKQAAAAKEAAGAETKEQA